jgi:hypothetical protein
MACNKEVKTIDKSSSEFYTKKLNESCSKYKNVDIKSSNEIILDFFEYKNLIIYGGLNSISVYNLDSKILVDKFQENELVLRKIDIINDKVVACTQKGMFEIGPTGTIKKVSNDACFDFIKFNNQYLYVSYIGKIDINNRDLTNIKILNTENYSFTLYLDPNYTDKNIFLMKLIEYKGKLFALASLDNKINIIEIENVIPTKILNKENDQGLKSLEYNMSLSDIHPIILNDEFFLLANPNSLAKYLLKYENGGFKQEMIWEEGYLSDDYKFKQFNFSHFTKIIQHDKKVNINTSDGLFTFTYENGKFSYDLLIDPLLPSNNWISHSIKSGQINYVLTNQRNLTQIICD